MFGGQIDLGKAFQDEHSDAPGKVHHAPLPNVSRFDNNGIV